MNIESLHTYLESKNINSPVISIQDTRWKNLLFKSSEYFFDQLNLPNLSTTIRDIECDIFTHNITPIKLISPTIVSIDEYELVATLRISNRVNFISKFIILLKNIQLEVKSNNGKVNLEVLSGDIDKADMEFPLDGSRDIELIYLSEIYSPNELEAFIKSQEPSFGELLAEDILGNISFPIEIIDLQSIFPGFEFRGEFEITQVDLRNALFPDDLYQVFMPKYFSILEPSECNTKEVENRIYTENSVVTSIGLDRKSTDISIDIKTGTKPVLNGVIANSNEDESDIFLYLPEEISSKIFNPRSALFPLLLNDAKGIQVFWPFYISYGVLKTLKKPSDVTWDKNKSTAHLSITVDMDIFVEVKIRVFRLKKRIAVMNTPANYKLDFSSNLYELASGNLDFVGEMNEHNIFVGETNFESILPERADRVIGKFLGYILEPLIKKSITFILKYAGFPVSGMASSNITKIRDGRNVQTYASLTQYISSDTAATLGISTRMREVHYPNRD